MSTLSLSTCVVRVVSCFVSCVVCGALAERVQTNVAEGRPRPEQRAPGAQERQGGAQERRGEERLRRVVGLFLLLPGTQPAHSCTFAFFFSSSCSPFSSSSSPSPVPGVLRRGLHHVEEGQGRCQQEVPLSSLSLFLDSPVPTLSLSFSLSSLRALLFFFSSLFPLCYLPLFITKNTKKTIQLLHTKYKYYKYYKYK